MNKYLLLAICTLIACVTYAQDKYMSGAVPEVDGKVVFTKSIAVKQSVTDDQLYTLMEKWGRDNYKANEDDPELNNRVVLSDPDGRDIACTGEKYLTFKKSTFSLDRAEMSYQLILNIAQGKCNATIRNIKYGYGYENSRHGGEKRKIETAEETIIDKIAINKKGDKLNRYYDKFRMHTIDTVNSIFNSIDVYLNGISTVGVAVQQPQPATATIVSAPVVEEAPVVAKKEESYTPPVQPVQEIPAEPIVAAQAVSSNMPGFRQVSADKIPGNYIKLLNEWTLITSGTAEQVNVMTASWGGLGVFWEKPVAFCFLNPTRYSVQTMDKGDTYTISFYTEAYKDNLKYCGSVSGRTTDKIKGSGLTPIKTPSGATAFAEAWMILECKKVVSQQLSPDAIVDKNLPGDWSKDGYHKMYIGEILNVWIK